MFEEALKYHSDGVLLFDNRNNLLFCNDVAGEYFAATGISLSEMSLDDFLDFAYSNQQTLDKDQDVDFELFTRQENFQNDFREFVQFGQYLLLLHGKALPDNQAIIYLEDIGNIKKRYNDLTQALLINQRLVSAADMSRNGIAIFGTVGDCLLCYANKSFERILGRITYDVPVSLKEIVNASDSLPDWSIVTTAMQSNKQCHQEIMVKEEDTEFWYLVTISPYHGQGQALKSISIVINDITEQKNQQEEKLKNQKMEALAMLAGGVSHDFNNILSIVQGYTNMIMNDEFLSDDVKRYLDRILQASQRGRNLTKQLLTFEHNDIGKIKPLNVKDMLLDLHPLMLPLLGPNVNLDIRCREELWIEASVTKIEQVFVNLIVNANDAMPDGGDIIILCESLFDNGRNIVQISVSDNGSGISQSDISKVFEAFYTTKKSGKGTGLGLATVAKIIEQSGGEIDLQSIVGQGCKFIIKFPDLDKPISDKKC